MFEIDKLFRGGDSYDFWSEFKYHLHRLYGAIDILTRIDDRFQKLKALIEPMGATSSYYHYGNKTEFSNVIDELISEYSGNQDTCVANISRLDDEEVLRIEEAYHTLCEGCYWSSVLNSAVAIERRLFVILKSRNTKFMRERRSDLKFTLGSLVGLYLDNKKKFYSCIPGRHDYLLKLVNEYRIISAHSKQQKLDKSTTNAMLTLTIKFLVDEKCQPVRRGRKKD
jgi:hypothetical protein